MNQAEAVIGGVCCSECGAAPGYSHSPKCRSELYRRIERYREIIFFYAGHKDDCPKGRAPATATQCLCGYDARMSDAL